jgi:hypothetical protein
MLYFVKFKILTGNFCGFYCFIYFFASFYSIWIKNISKFRETSGLHDYRLGFVLNRSEPVLKDRSFPVFLEKKWKDQDCGPGQDRS